MLTYSANEAEIFVDDVKVVELEGRVEIESGGFHSVSRVMSTGGTSGHIVRGDDTSRPIPAIVRFTMRSNPAADGRIQSWKMATRNGHGSTLSVCPTSMQLKSFEHMFLTEPTMLGQYWKIEFKDINSKINC